MVFCCFFFTSSPHLWQLFKDRRLQWTVAVKMLILFTVELCAMIRLVSRQALSQQKKRTLYFFAANVRHVVNSKWENTVFWLQCLQLHSLYQHSKLEEKGGFIKEAFSALWYKRQWADSQHDPETCWSMAPNERRTGLAWRKPVNDRAPRDDTAGPCIHLYVWYSLRTTPEVSASRAENHINIKEMHPGGLWVIKGKRQQLRRFTPVQGLVLDKWHVVEGVRNPPTSVLHSPSSHLPPSSAASQPSYYTQSQWFARNEFDSKQQEK